MVQSVRGASEGEIMHSLDESGSSFDSFGRGDLVLVCAMIGVKATLAPL